MNKRFYILLCLFALLTLSFVYQLILRVSTNNSIEPLFDAVRSTHVFEEGGEQHILQFKVIKATTSYATVFVVTAVTTRDLYTGLEGGEYLFRKVDGAWKKEGQYQCIWSDAGSAKPQDAIRHLFSQSRSQLRAVFLDRNPSISGDGQFIVFERVYREYKDQYNQIDILLFDRKSKGLLVINKTARGISIDGNCMNPVIDSSGENIVYLASINNKIQLVKYSRSNNDNIILPLPIDESSVGFGYCNRLAISPNGRYVVLNNSVSLLRYDLKDASTDAIDPYGSFPLSVSDNGDVLYLRRPLNKPCQVFVRRHQGEPIIVSKNIQGVTADEESGFWDISISGDGRSILFPSYASNLTTDASSSGIYSNVFLADTRNSAIVCISKSETTGNNHSGVKGVSISYDGVISVFQSNASNICEEDKDAYGDIYLFNSHTNSLFLIPKSTQKYSFRSSPKISENGNVIVFTETTPHFLGSTAYDVSSIVLYDLKRSLFETIR